MDLNGYLALVRKRAIKVRRRWPTIELGELLAVGGRTLVRCLARADPAKGDLTHYLSRSLARDMQSYARRHAGAPATATPVDDDELGAGSEDAVIAALDAKRAVERMSHVLPTLSDRERAVLAMLHDGLCLDDIAERLGIARKTACRAHLAAKERLKRAISTSRAVRPDLRR